MKNKVESRKYGVGISIVLVMILVTILSSCKKTQKEYCEIDPAVEQMGVYPY